jgi:hypothetical protein
MQLSTFCSTVLRCLFLLTIGLIIDGCRKDKETDPVNPPSAELSIAEAKKYFEDTQQRVAQANNKTRLKRKKLAKKVFWQWAFEKNVGPDRVVQVPILFEKGLNQGMGFRYLLFFKVKGKTCSVIVEYILNKSTSKDLSKLSSSQFEGKVILYDEEGDYLDGWAIRNGQKVAKVMVGVDGVLLLPKVPKSGRVSNQSISRCYDMVIDAHSANGNSMSVETSGFLADLAPHIRAAIDRYDSYTITLTPCGAAPSSVDPIGTNDSDIQNFIDNIPGFTTTYGGWSGSQYVVQGNYNASLYQAEEFLQEFGHLFSTEEEEWIFQNGWAVPNLRDYLHFSRETLVPPGRPDLGFLGNIIRFNLGSNFNKNLFDRWWVGTGEDYILSFDEFWSIVQAYQRYGKVTERQHNQVWRGQTVDLIMVDFGGVYPPPTEEYSISLGNASIYVKPDGPVDIAFGFRDEYNFDGRKESERPRSDMAEFVTRLMAEYSPKSAKSFNIYYPRE